MNLNVEDEAGLVLSGHSQAPLGRLLLVEDDPIYRSLLTQYLSQAGFLVDEVESLRGMRGRLNALSYEAVVIDAFLGQEDGLDALPLVIAAYPRTKVFVMSSGGTIEKAVAAMERGATAFIAKSKDPRDLAAELKARILPAGHLRLVGAEAGGPVDGPDFDMIGTSVAINAVRAKIEQFSKVDSTVLITGASGTGKELVARAIHSRSARGKSRFEALNCAAIPEALLESELFGHKRGAFTDAKADRRGAFERCDHGVLLLDEIGELPIGLQAKLLRVLQEREVMPLGGSQVVKITTRVIAATNRDLLEEVARGRFREDLYFRLAVLMIDVPPLCERREDIPGLARFFVERYAQQFNRPTLSMLRALELRLKMHDWPGNVRELQNAIERAVVLSEAGELRCEDLFPQGRLGSGQGVKGSIEVLTDRPLSEAKAAFEKAYLEQLLQATRGNISEMARLSGRYRADIYKLLTKHGIVWEDFRTSVPSPG